MTDHDDDLAARERERAERIRRLQERRGTAATRAAAGVPARARAAGRPATERAARTGGAIGTVPGATAPPRRTATGRRRRHHYNASRTLLAGLSVTGFFSILAALGLAQPGQPATTAPPVAAPAAAPATGGPAAQATAPQANGTAVSSSATPTRSAPAPKPVTRSHGS